jgi:hypothetical protein
MQVISTFKTDFYSIFIKITLFFTLFWVESPRLLAQKITTSEPYTLDTREDYMMVGRIADTSLFLLYEEDNFRLMQFDAALKTRFTEKIQPERHSIDLLQIVLDKTFFTVLYKHSGGGRSSLKAMRISSQGKILDSLTLQSTNQWGVVYQPRLVLSDDRSKVLAYDLMDNNAMFNAVVFDTKTFKTLWARSFRPAALDYHNSLHQALVDNAGGVYWTIERDNRKAKIMSNRFEIIYYTPELSQEWSMLVPMPNRFWQKAMFVVDNKNKKLLCAGFCSTKKAAKSEGVFYFTITPLFQNVADVFFSDFDATFMQQIMGKTQGSNAGFEDMDLRQLVVRADGGVVMVGEHYKKYVRYTTNPAMTQRGSFGTGMPMDTRTTTDYEYHDILLVSIQANGQKNWNALLPKRQFSEDDDGLYSSFFILKNKTGLRFLYNDEIKSGGNVNEYLMQTDGTAQRRNIFNSEKQNLQLVISEAKQVSANALVLPSLVRNKLQMVEIQY